MRETVAERDTVRETVFVFDTLRETTTVRVNAEGDTVSCTREREHTSDRVRGHERAIQKTEASEARHSEEKASTEKQTTVDRTDGWRWNPFLWGAGAGLLLATIIFVALRKWFKR